MNIVVLAGGLSTERDVFLIIFDYYFILPYTHTQYQVKYRLFT